MFYPRTIDETGKVYGRLTVLRMYDKNTNRSRYYDKRPGAFWVCRCECSEEVIVYGGALRRGQTRSCGCLRSELSSERGLKRWAKIREET